MLHIRIEELKKKLYAAKDPEERKAIDTEGRETGKKIEMLYRKYGPPGRMQMPG